MVITELRSQFKSDSGRDDLSTMRIDEYINSGIRLLDQLSNFEYSPAKDYKEITAGTRSVNFTANCAALVKVWLIDATTGRTKLDLVPNDYYHSQYGDYTAASGKPTCYTPRIVRPADITLDPTLAPYSTYSQYIDIIRATEGAHTLRGLLLAPAADKSYLLELEGKFYSPTLRDGTVFSEPGVTVDGGSASGSASPAAVAPDPVTENWWSRNYSTAVIDAALYLLYSGGYRNMEGATPYMNRIMTTLKGLDYDQVLEEMSDVDKMEG
jgi:hypothetical protein